MSTDSSVDRPSQAPPGLVQRWVEKLVDVASTWPRLVVGLTLGAIVFFGWYSRTYLELRTSLEELLPRQSPGLVAYMHQAAKVGGGAKAIIVVESPSREANEKLIDAIDARIAKGVEERKACAAKCTPNDAACDSACGPNDIAYVEAGTKNLRKFYQDNKWLYAELKDLEEADSTLDHQIAIRSGLVTDLFAETPKVQASRGDAGAGAAAASDAGATNGPEERKKALGLEPYRKKWNDAALRNDEFPTGYFTTPEGTMHGISIVSTMAGIGGAGGDALVHKLEGWVKELEPTKFHPEMKWGFAGDIANAKAEKESLLSDAVWASALALVLVLVGIGLYFRSLWALPVIALPAFVGVSAAYAFATLTFGYVNAVGAFLGAIVLGNGINYPIVLLGRYREFRARGMSAHEARRSSVWNAFRAELVGALVAAIAYGSLTVTRFRGFNQFGLIGFVGMLLVWLSMIPCVPAFLTLLGDRADPKHAVADDGTSGPVMRVIASLTERYKWFFVIAFFGAAIYAGVSSVNFLRDPWEYNFSALGSKATTQASGVGDWSLKADRVFGGKMNIAGARMIADSLAQVPELKAQILANDRADPEGQLVEKIVTVWDMLPGDADEQKKKLAVLESIRDRLTPSVVDSLPEKEQQDVHELMPPESIHLVEPKHLPPIVQRRFMEKDGTIGTVTYVKFKDLKLSDGHVALRIAKTTDNVKLPSGQVVQTASFSSIYAEMITSMRRDGPLASVVAFVLVALVVIFATANLKGAAVVIVSLLCGVVLMIGGAAWTDTRFHYVNFIALPITLGIGCEYPFNVYDRSRLLKGDVTLAVRRTAGAVTLCSYSTIVGYSSLLFNDFGALQSFGRLAMAGEIACIAAALFLVPSLLHLLHRNSRS